MPPLPPDDYYALLGVDAAADGAALRVAWRRLAARWHPDRAGVAATETFQRLSTAYAVLSDPVARIAYDRRRRDAGLATPPAPRPAAPSRPAAPAVMISRLCKPLALLLTVGAARYDDDGFITLALRDSEAAQGGMVTIPMRVDVWCPDCAGGRRNLPCPRCAGRRIVEEVYSAWLAFPPGVAAGEVFTPSAELPGMIEPVRFRVALSGTP